MSKLNKNFLWGGASKGAFRIEYSLGQQMLSPVDYRFEDIAVPLWNEVNPGMEIESIYDGYDDAMEAISEDLKAMNFDKYIYTWDKL
ncbi:hypothetical protein MKY53_06460 [Macrococcus sp. FSL R5-0951]